MCLFPEFEVGILRGDIISHYDSIKEVQKILKKERKGLQKKLTKLILVLIAHGNEIPNSIELTRIFQMGIIRFIRESGYENYRELLKAIGIIE